MGRAALEFEEALAVVYERAFRQAGRFFAQQFGSEAVVATGDWIPPAGAPGFDSEEALSAAEAQREEVARAIQAEFARGVTDLAISFDPADFQMFSPDLMQGLGQHAGRNFDAASTDALGKVVADSFNQGLSVPDTAKAIRARFEKMGKYTATMLARTDLIGIANGGGYMAARMVYEKQPAQKVWLNSHDARVRPSHADAGGQAVAMDAPFNVGGFELMYPGDPQGPPQEVINCRCTFTVEEGERRAKIGRPEFDEEGFKIPDRTTMVSEEIFGDTLNTRDLYATRGEDGEFTWFPSRVEAVHKPAVARVVDEGSPVRKGQQPETLFLAGGSGVGKTTVRNGLKGWEKGGSKRSATIDPDGMKESIGEYQRMVDAFDQYAAYGVHEESSMLAKTAEREINERRINAVYDGTGDGGPGSFLKKLQKAEAAGRKVQVVLVDTPLEDAIERVNDRALKSGRHIEESIVRDIHQKVSARFPEYRDKVDWQIWSTYNPKELEIRRHGTKEQIDALEQTRELVAESKGGVEKIYNPDKLQAFLDKANG